MPSYTDIEFLKIGPKINVLVDGSVAAENTKYPKDSTFKIQKKNASDIGEPFEVIKYKAYNGSIESNVGTIQVSIIPDKTNAPSGNNLEEEIMTEMIYDLGNKINLNSSSDRIKIVSFFQNSGRIMLGTYIVSPGDYIMKYDFSNLKFISYTGTGTPYQEFRYKAANISEESSEENYIKLNINGLGGVFQNSYTGYQDGEFYKRMMSISAENLRINKKAKIKIEIESSNAWIAGTENQILFDSEGLNKIYTGNVSEELEFTANEYGVVTMLFNIVFKQLDINAIDGYLKVTLISVDGQEELVTPSLSEIILDFQGTAPDPDDP